LTTPLEPPWNLEEKPVAWVPTYKYRVQARI